MATKRHRMMLLLASIVALVVTVGGAAAAAYGWLSTRAVRWGDHLIVGPRFNGEVILDGGATRIRVWREDGVPVLDAPSFAGRGTLYVTFMWGFAIYHTPPGTMPRGKAPARKQ
jgi:hypothetical protein